MLKRLFDIVIAAFALTVASPLILISAIAVRLSSPGPAFYKAKRAGINGSLFYMYKFRTMRIGLDRVDRRVTQENDDRITAVGNILRKTKLDEIPQFWNVLIGEMSVVGPRPEDWDIVQNHFSAEQMQTLNVRPGIASFAEVQWYPDLTYHDPPPADTPIQEWYVQRHMPAQLSASMNYIEQQNFWLDLKIIFQTAQNIIVYSWVPPRKRPLTLSDHD